MEGVEASRLFNFDRNSHFELNGGCAGSGDGSAATPGNSAFTTVTRKASPFDDSTGNFPILSSYLPRPQDDSSSGIDPELRDVLRKLINWLSDAKKSESAEGTSPSDTKPNDANEALSEKQMLASILVLLIMELAKNNGSSHQAGDGSSELTHGGTETPDTRSNFDSLVEMLEENAAATGMDADLLSLLKEILALLTGRSEGSQSGSNDKGSVVDKLFDGNSATDKMDPTLVGLLKELLTLLLSRKEDATTDAAPAESNRDSPSSTPSDSSISDMVSDAVDSSPLANSLDPAVLSLLKELLTFLLGGRKDGSMVDGVTPSKAEDLLDPSSQTGGTSSELQSLIAELLTLLTGDARESAPQRGGDRHAGGEPRDTKTVTPEQSGTTKVTPEGDGSTENIETRTETPDSSRKGEVIVVDEPIVVDGGVFDGKGAIFTASSRLGDGSQAEGQQPIFILKNGATLKNVDLGENGADGIHVYNGATLENVHWLDVGEDALTVKSTGDVNILGGSARGATDKIFQVNAGSTIYIKDFDADGFTSLVRTNGGKQLDVKVTIEGGTFSNGANLFRTDSATASVTFIGDIALGNVKNWKREGDLQSGT